MAALPVKISTGIIYNQQSFVDYIFESNRLEETLPDEDHQTIKNTLARIYDNQTTSAEQWLEDGNPTSEPQMTQHMLALRYVMNTGDELGPAMIKNVHKLLMTNSVYECRPLLAGECRKNGCHSGSHQYPAVAELENGLKLICHDYNLSTQHWVLRAAALYSGFLILHPFENGNGRTARLLLAYVARRFGLTLPLILTSGHRRAKQHCCRAVVRSHKSMQELNTLVLVSVSHALAVAPPAAAADRSPAAAPTHVAHTCAAYTDPPAPPPCPRPTVL